MPTRGCSRRRGAEREAIARHVEKETVADDIFRDARAGVMVDARGEGQRMYIGGGVLVLILIIIVVVLLMRR
jgi:hypothetical protein